MVGGVATAAVDALGVVVESTTGVDEHQYRCVAVMCGGEIVDRLDRLAGAEPVGGGVEFATDHHHRRQPRRWIGGIPGRREIDQLATVPETRCRVADVDGHHGALRRDLALLLHGGHGDLIGLVRQRSGGQLVPRGCHGGEVADPQIQRERGAEQAQRHRRHRDTTPPPPRPSPAGHQDRRSEAGQSSPDPQRTWCGVVGEPLRGDVPVGRRGKGAADDQRPRQPAHLPASATPTDRGDHRNRGDHLHGRRNPSVHQGEVMTERFGQCHSNIVARLPCG